MNVQAFYPDSANSHFAGYNVFTSNDNSPESVLTNITPPPESPGYSYRACGPPLLPKIRCQDQIIEPSSGPVRHSAKNSASYLYTYALQRPMANRRSASPPEAVSAVSEISSFCYSPATAVSNYLLGPSPSPQQSPYGSALSSPIALTGTGLPYSRRPSIAHARAVSASAAVPKAHNRSSSASSLDEATLLRHGYPTQYRQIPQYLTAEHIAQSQTLAAPSMSFSQSIESVSGTASDSGVGLATDFDYSFAQETTSLMSYLAETNVAPHMVRRIVNDQMRNKDWSWWDVRNLRSWSDFTTDAIMRVPQFPDLLHVPIEFSRLPHPSRNSQAPETEVNLRKIYSDFFATKVNAALEQTQGKRHLFMQAINSATTSPTPKPDFISNYADDYAFKTLGGDHRGRLVGLVKAYNQWNTGMRSGDPSEQVKYLRGLAHLHRVMREHGCRYGFIITEVELLCVRAGAKDSEYKPKPNECNSLDDGPVPVFGFLETAKPISLCTSGSDPETGATQMTAALALWYLHMLAKDGPLPGQPSWKLAVSGVAAHTRSKCEDRDAWMPKVAQHEIREAKRMRGWVWPTEPISRKEYPNKKRQGNRH